MQIVPMRDLKDTVRIEALCAQENGPVFITKNGYGRLVVMDIEYYERTMRQLNEAAALAVGLKDAAEGRIRPGEDVLSEMKEKYEPNAATLAAMESAEKGEDLYGPFDNMQDLMEALNA